MKTTLLAAASAALLTLLASCESSRPRYDAGYCDPRMDSCYSGFSDYNTAPSCVNGSCTQIYTSAAPSHGYGGGYVYYRRSYQRSSASSQRHYHSRYAAAPVRPAPVYERYNPPAYQGLSGSTRVRTTTRVRVLDQ